MRRSGLIIAVLVTAVAAAVGTTPARLDGPSAAEALLTGWLTYPARVLPGVTFNGDGIVGAAVAFAGLALGAHLFLRWFYAAVKPAHDTSHAAGPRASWPMRWTAVLLALFVLSFAAIISTGLVFHQVGWLLSAPHSIYSEAPTCRHTSSLLSFLPDSMEFGQPPKPLHPDWLACIHFVPIVDDAGMLREVVAYPRDPGQQREFGVCVVREEGREVRPYDQIQRTLAEESRMWADPRPPLADPLNVYCGTPVPRVE